VGGAVNALEWGGCGCRLWVARIFRWQWLQAAQ